MSKFDEEMSVAEVARSLGCSKAHVYNAINGRVAGLDPLPAIVMGRRKVIRTSTFEGWKKAQEQTALDQVALKKQMIYTQSQKERIAHEPESLIAQLSALLTARGKEIDPEGPLGGISAALRDLLTDVRHFCDVHDLPFAEIDRGAYQVYIQELEN